MARDDKANEKNLENLKNKSSLLAYGVSSQLEDEQELVSNIIKQTIIGTKRKLGERTNEKPINYYNETQFGEIYNQVLKDNKDSNGKATDKGKNLKEFKRYMNDNSNIDIGGLLLEDGTRTLHFNNYRIIHKHIPECAQALNIYKDNILSPDDYTKLIFNIKYTGEISDNKRIEIERKLDSLTKKYNLENDAESIIEETLELGEQYVAVLSLDEELDMMLSEGKVLNESMIQTLDKDLVDLPVLSENVEINKEGVDILNEMYDLSEDKMLTEESAKREIAALINENVQIGSAKEFLIERAQAEYDKNKNDVDIYYGKKKKGSIKKKDDKPLYLSGSSLRRLAPERVCELKIDNICYGYYYAEEIGAGSINNRMYTGASSGRNVNGTISLAQNNTVSGVTTSNYTSASFAAKQFGIGETKLRVISDLFLNAISKKIDKDFVRNHKDFKDFIYDLVKQNYIIQKGVRLTYFRPDEVVKFEVQPIYRDITFFAKLYLSILTNNLLIKMGRAHDKRIFYVNVGADAAYEQAIQSVIQDIKTKDYKMENLNDFNTVLNLAPGRFDDYYMPTINGERPVEIDTLAGMDVDMNNDFVEYLKNSLMSGMGCPRNLIDVTSEVDYARSISAMNANFVRSVVRYQKRFAVSFTQLYQKLYQNEYKYTNDGKENNNAFIDIDKIEVSFPSPATLAMSNISEQIQAADVNADFIANQFVPMKQDGSNEDLRQKMKTEIIKDMIPNIDWDRYADMLDRVKKDYEKEKIETPQTNINDPYGGAY